VSFEIFSGAESEKRAGAALWRGGKGKWAAAGAAIPAGVLRSMLRTDAPALARLSARTGAASLAAGAAANNGQLANGLAAIFIACGQDVANVANAAVGITRFEELADGAVYASVTLPSLTVGTVGGGTALATSHECLSLLDCSGAGRAGKFAAAITAGELGAAHDALGRNRPGLPE
jgi:hydroxymethylglutaryl-CoA reductase (NADPH)